MAEIPIERKSGIPWWVWLLLALVAIALLIYMFTGEEDEREAIDTTPAVVAPVDGTAQPALDGTDMATGPITDLTMLAGGANLASMVGRPVQLSNVQVQDVVGDRTFWVGPSASNRVLVVLDEKMSASQPGVEGRYDVTTGQTVNVSGMIQNVSDPAFKDNPIEGLPAGQDAVVRAQSLDIVQRP